MGRLPFMDDFVRPEILSRHISDYPNISSFDIQNRKIFRCLVADARILGQDVFWAKTHKKKTKTATQKVKSYEKKQTMAHRS